jgi:sugar porter (SP) family MFS transporter
VAALSGLLFGFDIAVINGAIIFLRQQFALTELQTQTAASSLLAGCVAGAAVAGVLSDRLGRRFVLMLSAVLFTLSSIGAAVPRDLTDFVWARLAGGVAIGVASVLAPVYIAEVAPREIRGRLVSLNQMAIVSGILLAYLVNWTLSFGGPGSWRGMFAAAAVPSLAFLLALFRVPESPRWLIERGRQREASAVLARVGGPEYARAEAEQIRAAVAEESGGLAQLLEPRMRRPLLLAVALAVLQQITGINTVLFYGSIIFREQMGAATETAAIGANVVIGLLNFLATLVALWTIDRIGRRPLLMIAAAGMAVCQIALAAAFRMQPPPAALVIGLMMLCVASFAVGLGPGVWVLLSEIFPTRIRGRAMSIATICLWIACTILTMTYLTLVRVASISGAFLIYASMCVVTFLIVWKLTPETRGRSLEEIERLWR